MNLLSLNLSKPINRSALEYALDVSLEKGIENSYYGKNNLLHIFGISNTRSGGQALADASCTLPSKDASKDVYFVSCGGFF